MDAKTRLALVESIAKWERYSQATDPDDIQLNVTSCPLCVLFWKKDGEISCAGCPVREKTGRKSCFDTPYWDVVIEFDVFEEVFYNSDSTEEDKLHFAEQFRGAALREKEFLESLLPAANGEDQ